MALPPLLHNLSLPVIAAPMFTISYPELVIAQCRAGIVGTFPALNARPAAQLSDWLDEIRERLAADGAAARPGPLAVNQIIHASNTRLESDLRVCAAHRVPILITSLRAPMRELVDEVHRYGGLVLHDVVSVRHAGKALEAGVDGLILVCAGAGGHAGTLSPFALLAEVRRLFDGPLVLSGAIGQGAAILAAQAMGADLAYIGTRFIATREAQAAPAYKQALVDAGAADIVYTDHFTGIRGNYLRHSIVALGLDPDALPAGGTGAAAVRFDDSRGKAWKDVWGAGQGVGAIDDVPPLAELVGRMRAEYAAAARRITALATDVAPLDVT
ncbi:nitronate monooxygenase family protein [Robbsia sp. Bb-Pol-6]|uniref:Nitronate monooxygenase family protein n=1 Tax=Robbsia betulipollinis TaxID=2981849 RepID=A0ABT3ZRL4_9BURK|nr:nitronate monooxygenase family protein [Robbsia betulipollinis]MCY0389062.1 nitronate monooxygenase family protein [Robbsia betulipollinis]